MKNPSIFYTLFFDSGLWGRWRLSPPVYRRKAGYTLVHVFGLWEEARVPTENPGRHREYMQSPYRKSPGRTQHLLAAGQQCFQLRHCAAPMKKHIYTKQINKFP
ncbi:hypothetical protein ILYODFUR_027570 [Ilyodon furcidens]|uniref:Uncharacterized protein n=1 Tax=Ilyodon furcidens TaxID=33524 RepID=A0ABV0T2Y5_9TELE